jgi:dipeptidyl aminopeptidase/acylaminoacyl peptidase
MLLVVGTADPGLVPSMDQVFVGLTRLRRDVTYLRYDGEGHVLRRYANLVDYWTRVLAFLDHHLQASQAVAPVPHTE